MIWKEAFYYRVINFYVKYNITQLRLAIFNLMVSKSRTIAVQYI